MKTMITTWVGLIAGLSLAACSASNDSAGDSQTGNASQNLSQTTPNGKPISADAGSPKEVCEGVGFGGSGCITDKNLKEEAVQACGSAKLEDFVISKSAQCPAGSGNGASFECCSAPPPPPSCFGGGFGNANNACVSDKQLEAEALQSCGKATLEQFTITQSSCPAGSGSGASFECCSSAPPPPPPPPPPPSCFGGGFGNANNACVSDKQLETEALQSCGAATLEQFTITQSSCPAGSGSGASFECCSSAPTPTPAAQD